MANNTGDNMNDTTTCYGIAGENLRLGDIMAIDEHGKYVGYDPSKHDEYLPFICKADTQQGQKLILE